MKLTAALIGFLAIGLSFQAQADEDKVVQSFSCTNSVVALTVQTYESSTVAWVVSDVKTGKSEVFMGFVGDETANEFYSTDLGSDLHVKGDKATVTLTRFGEVSYDLTCTQN